MQRTLYVTLTAAFLILFALAGFIFWYLHQPLSLRQSPLEIEIVRGTNSEKIAQNLVAQGVEASPFLLTWSMRLSGRGRHLVAGYYRIETPLTVFDLLKRLSSGDVTMGRITFVEGSTFAQLRAAINAYPALRHDSVSFDDATLMTRLRSPDMQPEGWFFPDTYHFAKGSSDLDVLRQAHERMKKVLAAEWQNRMPSLPFKTPYDALILASIVEKETGQAKDRHKIAAVFVNRLRQGMLLQTDPTVIYGIGEQFDGNLRKKDLLADTPFNTYTRPGLPPTPIALPGLAAIRATLNPAPEGYLYFVAKGDGTSIFSHSLIEHNRAVNRFQKKLKTQ